MFAFIRDNLGSILVAAVVFGIFCAIVIRGIYNRMHHKGGCSCGGDCGCCPSGGICHPKE